jgi:hypothetical protein
VCTTDGRLERHVAEDLLRRRLDRSELRFHKDRFRLAESDRLADYFALVVIIRTVTSQRGSVPVLQWGVRINGVPAGYLVLTHGGTRQKFMPRGFGPGAREVADLA